MKPALLLPLLLLTSCQAQRKACAVIDLAAAACDTIEVVTPTGTYRVPKSAIQSVAIKQGFKQ